MPYKTGGGGKPELYNEENGEYTEEEKQKRNFSDFEKMLFHYYLECDNVDVPFPNYKWNNKNYCDLYIKHLKEEGINHYVEEAKLSYLLSYQEKHDKSTFLKDKLGYDEHTLYEDIMNNTDFNTAMYSELNKYGLKIIACTSLKSKNDGKIYLVTTVWEIKPNKRARFITLIPGGDKIWNFIYSTK